MRDELVRAFERAFGDPQGAICFRAPGRVNLIGEHTDYNDGFVLPVGVDRYVYFLVRRREDKLARIYSLNFAEMKEFEVDRLPGREGTWGDYIQGIIGEFWARGDELEGFEGVIYGDIPIGAGLGSSAALEVAVAYGMSRIFEIDISDLELVKLCQRAENDFVGANCGIMDQYVSFHAKRGKALFLDTRALTHQLIDLPLEELGLLVVDTGVKHSLASSEYNKRRKECEESVRLLGLHIEGLRALRDLTPQLLDRYEKVLPDRLQRRVRHVLEENLRVEQTVQALKQGDMARVGRLLFASHESLRDLYEVSSPELDFLVDLAQREGIIGARMTGAGFGGATIHLLLKGDIPDYRELVRREFEGKFGREPQIFEIQTSDGVKEEPEEV
ncbi:MAG TPA: galactokinase [Candidatus Latescibacteria bacterium]|nr:galactokinase [Candidatus Latescibacterota bacterium]